MILKKLNSFITSLALVAALNAFASEPGPLRKRTLLLEEERYLAPASKYVFFNHNSSIFERGETTRAASVELAKQAKAAGIPTIMTTTAPEYSTSGYMPSYWKRYYLHPKDVDFTMRSTGGAHNISFPNLREVIFSGGSLDLCLCEAIRDVARSAKFGENPLQFTIVAEATYADTYQSNLWKYGATVRNSDGSFSRDPEKSEETIALSEVIEGGGTSDLADFISMNLFDERTSRFCPHQYSNKILPATDLSLNDYSIDIRVATDQTRTVGSGPKKISLRILKASELDL